MLTLEQIYKIDPSLKDIPEKELLNIRDELYSLGEMAIDSFINKNDSKNPEWLLSNNDEGVK